MEWNNLSTDGKWYIVEFQMNYVIEYGKQGEEEEDSDVQFSIGLWYSDIELRNM